MMTRVLGIDLGLSGARAAIVDRHGALIARGRAQLAEVGTHEVSARHWQRAVIEAVHEALQAIDDPSIAAIGIGALGPCPVLLDDSLAPLGTVPLFSTDSGAETERQAMLGRLGLPGHELGPDHVLPRLGLWQRTRPGEISRTRAVVDAAGFLVAWLTGRLVIDPATRHDYVAEGLPQPVPLPATRPSTEFAGELIASAARELRVATGTPVTVGGYDSYVDLFGAGVRGDGEAGLVLGSTTVLGAVRGRAPDTSGVAAHGLRVTPYIGETSFVGGWTSSSGSLIAWAERIWPSEGARPLSMPGSGGLLALPYFAGERAPVWDPLARGVIVGLTLETSATDLRRALAEAVALSILDIGDRLAAVNGPIGRLRATGGGLRNETWAQDTADAIGLPLDVVANAGEAVGPAMLALAALGHDMAPRLARTLMPDSRRHARYRELLTHYRRLFPALRETLHLLGRLAGKET
jgi:xylulokinase